MKIIFYTLHCPSCEVLERRLKEKKLVYITETNPVIMEAKGITTVPQLEVNGELMNYGQAIKWLKNMEDRSEY